MNNIRSISTELLNAIKNSEVVADLQLLQRAITQGYYIQASQLIAKYDYDEALFDTVINILSKPIIHNKSEFTTLLLTLMLQSDKFPNFNEKMLFLFTASKECPSSNEYFLLIDTFLKRLEKKVKPNRSRSSLSQLKSSSEFFSVNILQKQLFTFLEEKYKSLKIKSVLPNKELLFSEERNTLNRKSQEARSICSTFIHSLEIEPFIEHITSFLTECLTGMKTIIEKGKNQTTSLMLSKSTKMSFSEIQRIAQDISTQYLTQIVTSPDFDSDDLLDLIQSNILGSTPPNFKTALFLSELIALLLERIDNDKLGIMIQLFQKDLLGFERHFGEHPTYKSLYKSCVVYPQSRNVFLNDPKTETSQMLRSFGKSLKYIQYVAKASFVNAVIRLERGSVQNIAPPELLQSLVDQANLCYNSSIAINEKVRALLKELKPYPWINYPDDEFEFDDDFPRYPFHPQMKLSDASIQSIFKLFDIKTELVSILPFGVLSTKVPICKYCGSLPAQLICGHCEQFVLCLRCAKNNCPICHNPL